MTILTKQSEIATASTADLVATYNHLTGKAIKKFASRGAGESQVANAILAGLDRANHKGVPKGKTASTPIPEDKPAKGKAKAAKAEPAPTPAKLDTKAVAAKVAANVTKKPKTAPAGEEATHGRKATYDWVKFVAEPDTTRRPNPESMRNKVRMALEQRGKASISQLTEDVGFNARSYVHKLVMQGWAEVIPAPAAKKA